MLNNNQIATIDNGTFDSPVNLLYLDITYNCIDTTDTAFQNYINSLSIPTISYSTQSACSIPSVENLNSTNIASVCPIDSTYCDLSNRGITSIASDTFV